MTSKFARLEEFDDVGQVLIMIEDMDGQAQVAVKGCIKGVFVTMSALMADESDEGWDRAERFLDTVDARAMADDLKRMYQDLIVEQGKDSPPEG